ncbi:unnamed protein product [Polarella glacialis]|uniref:Uncharacterized protein n=1 Tax=Polarella glacialis TaxID=89957 RepID=A0A813K9J3_POLGL|nr:unnamed protein product [Polarella glacialis]
MSRLFGGMCAYEKYEPGDSPHVLVYSPQGGCWKIRDSLEGKRASAFLKVQDGGKAPPIFVEGGDNWSFHDGRAWVVDSSVRCSLLGPASNPFEGGANRATTEQTAAGTAGTTKAAVKSPAPKTASAAKKKFTKKPVARAVASGQSHASTASESSSSDSESVFDFEAHVPKTNQPEHVFDFDQQAEGSTARMRPQGMVCSKMLIRAGLRCLCHFMHVRVCPSRVKGLVGSIPVQLN